MSAGAARCWLLAGLSLGVAAVAVSDQSLWIDEAHTAYKATQPDWRGLTAALAEEGGSDINMPLYMASMWTWDKIAGSHPEWLFRASNLLWLAVLQGSLCAALRSRPRTACWCVLATALSPFVWYYLNEARPYLMQLAGAGLVTGFFVRRSIAPAGLAWTVALAAGLLVLCGGSLLGVLWAGSAVLLLAWLCARREIVLKRADWLVLGVAGGLLAVLGAYYVHTFLVTKSKPTPGETGLLNVGFSFYELLGLAGLGPGRNVIRVEGLAAFRPYLPLLTVGGAAIGGLLLAGTVAFRRENRRAFWPLAVAWTLPVVALFVFGKVSGARVLGRHLAPALPAMLLLSGSMLARLWAQPRGRLVALLAVVTFLASGALLRFAERHAKDDGRAGLAVAREVMAAGGEVWWAGATRLLGYYGVPSHPPGQAGPGVIPLWNPTAQTLAALPPPEIVLLSRPDVFDGPGELQQWLAAHRYTCARRWQTLGLWRRPAADSAPAAPGN